MGNDRDISQHSLMILSIRGILSAFNFGYTKGNFGYFCNGGSGPSDKGWRRSSRR